MFNNNEKINIIDQMSIFKLLLLEFQIQNILT